MIRVLLTVEHGNYEEQCTIRWEWETRFNLKDIQVKENRM